MTLHKRGGAPREHKPHGRLRKHSGHFHSRIRDGLVNTAAGQVVTLDEFLLRHGSRKIYDQYRAAQEQALFNTKRNLSARQRRRSAYSMGRKPAA